MITITLAPQDLEQIRFTYSPLNELVTSFHMREHGKIQSSLQPWADYAARVLHGEAFPHLEALTMTGYMADFLTPPPLISKMLPVEAEIAAMRDVSPDLIRLNVQRIVALDGENAIRQQFMVYPLELLECLIEELERYWARVLDPYWARIRVVLENDTLYRERLHALKGVDETLSDLSPNVAYKNRTLTFEKLNKTETHLLEGNGAVFSPSVFKNPSSGLSWQIVPEYITPWMTYSARGSGNWFSEMLPDPEEQLRVALGDAPARLLIALCEPDHTSNLAKRLYLTAGAVSQQLKRLHQAGLVDSTRSGYKVYYRLSERGLKLLALFGA